MLPPPYDVLVPELKRPEYAGLDDTAALAHLQARRTPGPAPMWFTDLFGLVQSGTISLPSFNKVWKHERFSQFEAAVLRQDNLAVANLYVPAFEFDGSITQSEAAAIVAYASRTADNQPIPWAAQIAVGHILSARELIEKGA